MSLGPAPTAMRRPISRIRSVTDTSMMFMMPMPPTISEMLATAPSSSDMMRVVCGARGDDFGDVAHAEIVLRAGLDLVALAQQRFHLLLHVGQVLGAANAQRDLLHRTGGTADVPAAPARGFQRHQHHVVLVLAEAALALWQPDTPTTVKRHLADAYALRRADLRSPNSSRRTVSPIITTLAAEL